MKIILLFSLLLPKYVNASEGIYYCVSEEEFTMKPIYVYETNKHDVITHGKEQFYAWTIDGREFDQGSYDSSMKRKLFASEYNYSFHVRHIMADYYFNCKHIESVPKIIQRQIDKI